MCRARRPAGLALPKITTPGGRFGDRAVDLCAHKLLLKHRSAVKPLQWAIHLRLSFWGSRRQMRAKETKTKHKRLPPKARFSHTSTLHKGEQIAAAAAADLEPVYLSANWEPTEAPTLILQRDRISPARTRLTMGTYEPNTMNHIFTRLHLWEKDNPVIPSFNKKYKACYVRHHRPRTPGRFCHAFIEQG